MTKKLKLVGVLLGVLLAVAAIEGWAWSQRRDCRPVGLSRDADGCVDVPGRGAAYCGDKPVTVYVCDGGQVVTR